MKAAAKKLFAAIGPLLLIFGVANALYEWGYYRGYRAGQLEMKCAVFGVMDRLTEKSAPNNRYVLANLGCRTNGGRVVQ